MLEALSKITIKQTLSNSRKITFGFRLWIGMVKSWAKKYPFPPPSPKIGLKSIIFPDTKSNMRSLVKHYMIDLAISLAHQVNSHLHRLSSSSCSFFFPISLHGIEL